MKSLIPSRRHLSRSLRAFLFLLPLVAASCDEPDQFQPEIVHSETKPDTIYRGEVMWIPRQVGSGTWSYQPEQLRAFEDRMNGSDVGHIESATLVVKGRRWVLTSTNHYEEWIVCPPWEQTAGETGQMIEHIFLGVVVISAVIAAVAAHESGVKQGTGNAEEKEKEHAKSSAEMRERERQLAQYERNAEAAHAKNLRWFSQAEEELNQSKSALERRETDLEQQRQRHATAMRDAEMMLRTPPDTTAPAAIPQYLRKQHLQSVAMGDLFTATYLADRSGFIRLAWKVQSDRPQPPMVRIMRDDKIIRMDARFSGEHGDHVVPGRRYLYIVSLLDDRGYAMGRGAQFEVKIPTAKAWDSNLGGDEDERQRKIREQFMSRFNGLKVTEELKQECTADVKAKGYPPDVEEWFLSKIDALAAELSGQGE